MNSASLVIDTASVDPPASWHILLLIIIASTGCVACRVARGRQIDVWPRSAVKSVTRDLTNLTTRAIVVILDLTTSYNDVTASFSQQTEDRAFCPVVQLF